MKPETYFRKGLEGIRNADLKALKTFEHELILRYTAEGLHSDAEALKTCRKRDAKRRTLAYDEVNRLLPLLAEYQLANILETIGAIQASRDRERAEAVGDYIRFFQRTCPQVKVLTFPARMNRANTQ